MMKRMRQRGFGAIMAIMVLVVLGALAAGIMKFGTVQGLNTAQDINAARAWQAAKAGTEWGLFQALQPGGNWRTIAGCNSSGSSPTTLNLSAETGFWVTVRCQTNPVDYNEGEVIKAAGLEAQKVRVLVITATACNASGACPNAAASVTQGYVERVRTVTAFCPVEDGNC